MSHCVISSGCLIMTCNYLCMLVSPCHAFMQCMQLSSLSFTPSLSPSPSLPCLHPSPSILHSLSYPSFHFPLPVSPSLPPSPPPSQNVGRYNHNENATKTNLAPPTCMYPCMHVCMYPCMRVQVYACTHVPIILYACTHVCMHPCMRVQVYPCMHVHMYSATTITLMGCFHLPNSYSTSEKPTKVTQTHTMQQQPQPQPLWHNISCLPLLQITCHLSLSYLP